MPPYREVCAQNSSPAIPEGMPGWKRALDIVLILLSLPLLAPLMLAVAAGIKLVSDGPVLFRQERIGFFGRGFMCLKFRTMAVGQHASVHQEHLNELMVSNRPMTKMDCTGDRRIIPFGLLLRASGLDELPQIFNVLSGDMSLVGPRPCVRYEYEMYQPWQKERFNAVPGLTGLWQVSGKNRTTFEQMIRFDIEYSRRKSFWLDCKIILKTIPALLAQMSDGRRMRKYPVGSFESAAVAPQQPVNH
jgi:lipopolysaccharide/colanic/teichoic acid biosynthesis glycosyltransferase